MKITPEDWRHMIVNSETLLPFERSTLLAYKSGYSASDIALMDNITPLMANKIIRRGTLRLELEFADHIESIQELA